MAWIKVESSVARNRKFLAAGPAASWLWLCGLAYCQEGLTDGFIPYEALTLLGPKGANNLKSKLVAAGLWDEVDGGWHVHNYLNHNKSAVDVERIRVERRLAGAVGGTASGEARRQQSAEANSKQPSNPSTATATSTEASTATSQRGTARPQPIIARRRLDAAWEGERLYVPQRTHQDFVALRGSEPELFAWYQQVADVWADRSKEPGADMIRFWKARYDETWPATGAKPHSRLPQWAR